MINCTIDNSINLIDMSNSDAVGESEKNNWAVPRNYFGNLSVLLDRQQRHKRPYS